MNNQLQLFHNENINADLRVFNIDGRPWFVAKDVCECLGTETSNIRKILDSDEVRDLSQCVQSSIGLNGGFATNEASLPEDFATDDNVFDHSNGGRAPLIVSESGLYHLAFVSRKPAARAFRRWVTDDVLPSIRATGSYGKATDVSERVYRDNQWLLKQNSAMIEKEGILMNCMLELTKHNKELQAVQNIVRYNETLQKVISDLAETYSKLYHRVNELSDQLLAQ